MSSAAAVAQEPEEEGQQEGVAGLDEVVAHRFHVVASLRRGGKVERIAWAAGQRPPHYLV
jgi:hypothetical protein